MSWEFHTQQCYEQILRPLLRSFSPGMATGVQSRKKNAQSQLEVTFSSYYRIPKTTEGNRYE